MMSDLIRTLRGTCCSAPINREMANSQREDLSWIKRSLSPETFSEWLKKTQTTSDHSTQQMVTDGSPFRDCQNMKF